MPYVNIPQSKIVGGIAKMSGKMLGELSNNVTNRISEVTSNFRRQGCPTGDGLQRIKQQKEGLERGISNVSSRISNFQKLPNRLKAPIGGLEAAINIIKILPIPQSVPPGFGIPVSITTKYADLLHKLKELIAQANENVEGISTVLETPTNFLSSINRMITRLDGAIRACEVETALQAQVDTGNISIQQLQDTGLVDEDGVFIFSKLGPIFVGQAEIDSNGILQNDNSDIESAIEQLNNALQRLEGANFAQQGVSGETSNLIKLEITKLLNLFKDSQTTSDTNRQQTVENSKFFHTGPDGTVYRLAIKNDTSSTSIAPRRFAVAIDPSNVEVLKGPKSFSSSTDILLNEIKFRIDNQLA